MVERITPLLAVSLDMLVDRMPAERLAFRSEILFLPIRRSRSCRRSTDRLMLIPGFRLFKLGREFQ